MDAPSPRYWELFFEVFEALPRQGPGSWACAEQAFRLCTGLPPAPAVLDLGCGVGAQTLYLAELAAGRIVAVDSHAPSIARLNATLAARGLSPRVEARVGDMADPGLPPGSFDLIWSEGALYNLGIDPALRVCRRLLRPGGCLAFTDAVWRKDDPPDEVRAAFAEYATMGRAEDIVALLEKHGFSLLGHFTLPDRAWWDDFYEPMERRIAALRASYRGDAEALAALDRIAEEPAMHRRHAAFYAYAFFVARAPGGSS